MTTIWVKKLNTLRTVQALLPIQHLLFPGGSDCEESTCNAGHLGSIPGLGRSPGEGKGYPLRCFGLEHFMYCMVHGVAKSWTRLNNFHFHFSPSLTLCQTNIIATIPTNTWVQHVTLEIENMTSKFLWNISRMTLPEPFWIKREGERPSSIIC